MKQAKAKKKILDIRMTLLLFAVLPLLITSIILTAVTVSMSSKELKQSAHNSFVSLITQIGETFDFTTKNNETVLINFINAPIVKEFLLNPNDPKLKAEAQQYTVDVFGSLEGWEGIYIADWNSQVMTHPAPPVVGRVMREGDSLKSLQDAMLAAENGVYNVGIITSPASGQLIMSMYAPVFDDKGNPIGYVGAGTFVNDIANKFADVSELKLDGAYVYYVDSKGTMLYHPDETKIGNPVENAAVKGVVSRIEAGEENITPECVEYLYKGAMKYAAYYVGENNAYVAVLTADEAEVLASTKVVTNYSIIIALVCVIICSGLAFAVSRMVSNPLKAVSEATKKLGEGDVTVECKAKSNVREISDIVDAYAELQNALSDSMTNVKDSSKILSEAIINVDGKTADNVESVSQISIAIDEVAGTSQTVAQSAQDMAEKAVELGNEIEVLSNNVSNLYDGSIVIQNANSDATDCMSSVFAGAKESVEAVEDIAKKISDTNEAVAKINVAIQSIESIATQTNLLSLNASIEAARAGEAGRGFSIVAEEIRTLADSSAQSAKEIKQIVGEVVDLSNDSVNISNRVREVINTQQVDIHKAQESFSKLSETVASSIEEINVIKQIAGSMSEIKVEFANATTDLGAISEELGAAAEEVSASCQTVSAACTDTQASTEEMRAINEHMNDAIEYFKLG